jgi:hypothetical protein
MPRATSPWPPHIDMMSDRATRAGTAAAGRHGADVAPGDARGAPVWFRPCIGDASARPHRREQHARPRATPATVHRGTVATGGPWPARREPAPTPARPRPRGPAAQLDHENVINGAGRPARPADVVRRARRRADRRGEPGAGGGPVGGGGAPLRRYVVPTFSRPPREPSRSPQAARGRCHGPMVRRRPAGGPRCR